MSREVENVSRQVLNLSREVKNVSREVKNVSRQVPNLSCEVQNVSGEVLNLSDPKRGWSRQVEAKNFTLPKLPAASIFAPLTPRGVTARF